MGKIETWKDRVEIDLYGRNGDPGMVREYRDSQAEHRGQQKLFKIFVAAVGLLAGINTIMSVIDKIHSLLK